MFVFVYILITGTLGDDIEKMITFFLHGLSYETVKVSDPVGKLTVPFGQVRQNN